MKNIHVLATDKPSRLYLYKSNGVLFDQKIPMKYKGDTAPNQNIYITDDSEIKEGVWVYDIFLDSVFTFESGEANNDYINENIKKIILTTDQDLVKDGVQAIPDYFIEWFVNNPSCESVEVRKECCGQCDERLCEVYDRGIGWNKNNTFYEIIIPKEKDYFPDIKIGSILSSEDIANEITELENQSFEGWTTDSIKGYLLACKNIKEKLI